MGKTLPTLDGTTLSGRRLPLPADARGKLTFLVLGFSYDARWDVGSWIAAFRDRFGQYPDVTFFEVPVIGSIYRWFAPMIEAGMRRGTPRELYDHVVTVYGDQNALREQLGALSPSGTWVYLMDGDGRSCSSSAALSTSAPSVSWHGGWNLLSRGPKSRSRPRPTESWVLRIQDSGLVASLSVAPARPAGCRRRGPQPGSATSR